MAPRSSSDEGEVSDDRDKRRGWRDRWRSPPRFDRRRDVDESRSPRGFKRPHDDRPRRRDDDRRRPGLGYSDFDRPRQYPPERKRPRNRTRSPHRRDNSQKDSMYDDQTSARVRDGKSGAKPVNGTDSDVGRDAKHGEGSSDVGKDTREAATHDEGFEAYDEDAEIERRRRRREELLAKSKPATPLLLQALHADKASAFPIIPDTPRSGGDTPMSDSASNDEAADFEFKATDLANHHGHGREDGPSAADYDPTADMREDGLRDEQRQGNVVLHGHPAPTDILPKNPQPADDFDMFADDFDEDKYVAKTAPKPELASATAPDALILEGDDKDGYYKLRIGEMLDGRYQVQAALGRGMFSGVARAVDSRTGQLVAIKMMRNNDALRKGGFTEIAILQKLNSTDIDGRKHIVRFERHFEHKGHLCLAFEHLSMNLREVLRKFGNNVGINLSATRAYAHQLFVSLAHLRRCSVIHADLKPDNILVNEARTSLKVCDLGTAIDLSDAATAHTNVTPYLVSRFYRAPEVILGAPYDYGVDMWSAGCTLYELYSGKILFAGDSNNQMLRVMMETRGRMSPKVYKRGELWTMHFDERGQFLSREKDKVLGKTAVRVLSITKSTRDIRTRLMAASDGMDDAEMRSLSHFADLLEQCLALNPEKRIKPSVALRHSFFTTDGQTKR